MYASERLRSPLWRFPPRCGPSRSPGKCWECFASTATRSGKLCPKTQWTALPGSLSSATQIFSRRKPDLKAYFVHSALDRFLFRAYRIPQILRKLGACEPSPVSRVYHLEQKSHSHKQQREQVGFRVLVELLPYRSQKRTSYFRLYSHYNLW